MEAPRPLPDDTPSSRRQQALRWIEQGLSASECARRLGVSRQTVSQWRKQFGRTGHLEPLKRGRRPLLDAMQRRAALALLDEPPEQHGFPPGPWTRQRIQVVLERRFGVHLSLASISGLTAQWREQPAGQRAAAVLPALTAPPCEAQAAETV